MKVALACIALLTVGVGVADAHSVRKDRAAKAAAEAWSLVVNGGEGSESTGLEVADWNLVGPESSGWCVRFSDHRFECVGVANLATTGKWNEERARYEGIKRKTCIGRIRVQSRSVQSKSRLFARVYDLRCIRDG